MPRTPADVIPLHGRSGGNLGHWRSDCVGTERPCPLVGCPYNTYLSVSPTNGTIKLTHPGREPEDVPPGESCSLDVADEGPHTLDEVARIMGLTRERIRQIEVIALSKLGRTKSPVTLAHSDHEPATYQGPKAAPPR